jgi:hypothetical protein
VCVDLMTDNANCGTCGTPCDYQCAGGSCGPKTLATGMSGVLALDSSTHALVMRAGVPSQGFFSCDTSGNAGPTLITANSNWIVAIAAGNGRFFFDSFDQGQLFTCTESGCTAPTSLGNVSGTGGLTGGALGFAVTPTAAYWTDLQSIWTCSTSGTCIPKKINVVSNQPCSVAVDGNDLYWGQATGEVYVSDLTGQNATLIAAPAQSGTANLSATIVLAGGGQVFWLGGPGLMTAGRTMAPTAYGGPTLGSYQGPATDGTNVYLLGTQNEGNPNPVAAVSKCAIGATCTTPTTIVPWSGVSLGPNIVVDAKNVYWSQNDNLTVFHK